MLKEIMGNERQEEQGSQGYMNLICSDCNWTYRLIIPKTFLPGPKADALLNSYITVFFKEDHNQAAHNGCAHLSIGTQNVDPKLVENLLKY